MDFFHFLTNTFYLLSSFLMSLSFLSLFSFFFWLHIIYGGSDWSDHISRWKMKRRRGFQWRRKFFFGSHFDIFKLGGGIRVPSIFAPQKQHILHPNNSIITYLQGAGYGKVMFSSCYCFLIYLGYFSLLVNVLCILLMVCFSI